MTPGPICLRLGRDVCPSWENPVREAALIGKKQDVSSPYRDSLLLETGFLAILVAPLRRPSKHKIPQGGLAGALPHEDLPFWLVRWLLFRLMFASGVVKLTSRCPAWWGLTGEGPGLKLGWSV